jgi:hypothetical protein
MDERSAHEIGQFLGLLQQLALQSLEEFEVVFLGLLLFLTVVATWLHKLPIIHY